MKSVSTLGRCKLLFAGGIRHIMHSFLIRGTCKALYCSWTGSAQPELMGGLGEALSTRGKCSGWLELLLLSCTLATCPCLFGSLAHALSCCCHRASPSLSNSLPVPDTCSSCCFLMLTYDSSSFSTTERHIQSPIKSHTSNWDNLLFTILMTRDCLSHLQGVQLRFSSCLYCSHHDARRAALPKQPVTLITGSTSL